jgi:nucleoside-diphosphate-sugar epimerase
VRAAADDTLRGYTWEELLGAAASAGRQPAPAFVRARGPLLSGPGPRRRPGQGVRLEQHGQLAEAARAAPSGLGRAAGGRATAPGWSPRFDLERGFADAVAWYRKAGWI